MLLQEVDNFKELEEKLYKLVCEIVREKLKETLMIIDEVIMINRDKDIFKNKDMKERTIKTLVGEITLKRRYYKDSNDDYHFLLDEYLGLPENDRQSPGLKEAAIDLVKDMSYRNSAEKIENLLRVSTSHTAIFNWVQKLGKKIAKEDEKKCHDLLNYGLIPGHEKEKMPLDHVFVEADGIHINLQEDEKKSGELKLAMSYRGWEKRHPSSEEYDLTGKKFFGGVFNSTQLWEETETKMYEYFKFNKGAVTVLNGDGASWVTTGKEYIPACELRLLDSFHWSRKIFQKLGRSSYVPKVFEAINDGDKEALIEHLKKAKSYRKRKKDQKKVDGLKKYLLNNWEGLKDYREQDLDLPDNVRGMGAMESNIDKVLANRFKKQGMRWSKDGARNLAKIIIADRNNELEEKMAQMNWDFEKKKIEQSYHTVKKKVSKDESEVLKVNIPALEGPESGSDWTKIFKNISDPIMHNPISRYS